MHLFSMTINIPRTLQCPVNQHRLKPQPGESLLIRIQPKGTALAGILSNVARKHCSKESRRYLTYASFVVLPRQYQRTPQRYLRYTGINNCIILLQRYPVRHLRPKLIPRKRKMADTREY